MRGRARITSWGSSALTSEWKGATVDRRRVRRASKGVACGSSAPATLGLVLLGDDAAVLVSIGVPRTAHVGSRGNPSVLSLLALGVKLIAKVLHSFDTLRVRFSGHSTADRMIEAKYSAIQDSTSDNEKRECAQGIVAFDVCKTSISGSNPGALQKSEQLADARSRRAQFKPSKSSKRSACRAAADLLPQSAVLGRTRPPHARG